MNKNLCCKKVNNSDVKIAQPGEKHLYQNVLFYPQQKSSGRKNLRDSMRKIRHSKNNSALA
jgi:hypothetical protein